MLDVAAEVAELFEDAQELGSRRVWTEEWVGAGVLTHVVPRRDYSKQRFLVKLERRRLRRARKPYVITPAGVRRETCPGCGAALEYREGMRRPVVLGGGGRHGVSCGLLIRTG